MVVQHECRLLGEMEVVEYTQMDVLSQYMYIFIPLKITL